MDEIAKAKLRGLPQVQKLLEQPDAARLAARFSRPALAAQLRAALDDARAELRRPTAPDAAAAAAAPDTQVPDAAALLRRARQALEAADRPALRRVINATGIVLHTNLGRAPLAPEAAEAVAAVARGYCNLEYDLAAGARGSRTQGVEPLLCQLTGAEAALAVNNNAAAVLLALSALAAGGEVLVSRGELVEIGGGFRVPDVIRQGGARLVEVGTTNKTRLADYRDVITSDTRVLLKIHQSNFRMVGFTEDTPLAELAALARDAGLLLVHDLGSGALAAPPLPGPTPPGPTPPGPTPSGPEPTVPQAVAAGADVVAFSGDKLMGGPQAGLLVGRAAAIEPMRRHPLLRALRLGKLSLAALEATLRLHRDRGPATLPVPRAMGQGREVLRARAERLARALGPPAAVRATTGFAGGGALPGEAIGSAAVALPGHAPDQLAARLRAGRPAVVGRIADGCLLLDVLAVDDSELDDLLAAVRAATAP